MAVLYFLLRKPFGRTVALIAAFLLVYLNVTPYGEITLIRQGNTAAAISLSGALIGFAMPVANVIAHSDTLIDLAAWGAVAALVQILAYLAMRLSLPRLAQDIPAGTFTAALEKRLPDMRDAVADELRKLMEEMG